METLRKPLQGVSNIIRFNWHFYVAAGLLCLVLQIGAAVWQVYQAYFYGLNALILFPLILSLLVSWYVYDAAGLYRLDFLDDLEIQDTATIANIHAGFDETSALLSQKFPKSSLLVLDFYDPKKHREISIRRARKYYPAFPNTQRIQTEDIALPSASLDTVFLLFAAHEIRNQEERVAFFRELHRVLKPHGKIVLLEHLRNLPNFVAYNLGFFHFLAPKTWQTTFAESHFEIRKTSKFTPFITCFLLEKKC